MRFVASTVTLLAALVLGRAQEPASPREGLQPLGTLVGVWRGTGTPAGDRETQRKNFWIETIHCEWKFKSGDAWLELKFEGSKHFQSGDIRFQAGDKPFRMTLVSPDKKSTRFLGSLQNRSLSLESEAGDRRLVFTLLHDNRFLYREEIRPPGKTLFAKTFQVGATKEGVPFAVGSSQPECIVTGGAGTSTVTYKGQTYYVCCSGCRDEFLANPEKYVREWNDKKTKK